jgi:hypothetical protein
MCYNRLNYAEAKSLSVCHQLAPARGYSVSLPMRTHLSPIPYFRLSAMSYQLSATFSHSFLQKNIMKIIIIIIPLLLTFSYQLLAFTFHLSAFSYELSAITFQLSSPNCSSGSNPKSPKSCRVIVPPFVPQVQIPGMGDLPPVMGMAAHLFPKTNKVIIPHICASFPKIAPKSPISGGISIRFVSFFFQKRSLSPARGIPIPCSLFPGSCSLFPIPCSLLSSPHSSNGTITPCLTSSITPCRNV